MIITGVYWGTRLLGNADALSHTPEPCLMVVYAHACLLNNPIRVWGRASDFSGWGAIQSLGVGGMGTVVCLLSAECVGEVSHGFRVEGLRVGLKASKYAL